jgi:hypothetical protein
MEVLGFWTIFALAFFDFIHFFIFCHFLDFSPFYTLLPFPGFSLFLPFFRFFAIFCIPCLQFLLHSGHFLKSCWFRFWSASIRIEYCYSPDGVRKGFMKD